MAANLSNDVTSVRNTRLANRSAVGVQEHPVTAPQETQSHEEPPVTESPPAPQDDISQEPQTSADTAVTVNVEAASQGTGYSRRTKIMLVTGSLAAALFLIIVTHHAADNAARARATEHKVKAEQVTKLLDNLNLGSIEHQMHEASPAPATPRKPADTSLLLPHATQSAVQAPQTTTPQPAASADDSYVKWAMQQERGAAAGNDQAPPPPPPANLDVNGDGPGSSSSSYVPRPEKPQPLFSNHIPGARAEDEDPLNPSQILSQVRGASAPFEVVRIVDGGAFVLPAGDTNLADGAWTHAGEHYNNGWQTLEVQEGGVIFLSPGGRKVFLAIMQP